MGTPTPHRHTPTLPSPTGVTRSTLLSPTRRHSSSTQLTLGAPRPSQSPSPKALTARAIQLTLQGYQVAEGTFPVQGFDPLHPDPAQLPQVGRFFAQGSAVRDRIPEELAALGEPKTGAAKWDRLRDNLIHSTSLAHTQIAAALAANAPAFAAAAAEVRNLSNKIHATGIALGFRADSSCADLF